MVKDREERVFCIWLKVGTVLSVQPINDFACKGFSKFAVNKSVIYGVWLTAVDAIFDLNRCRSPSLGACNSNTKPMSRHFYRPVYF